MSDRVRNVNREKLISLLRECRVLPVVTAQSVESTVQLARTLQRGGMKGIEITLRSDAALDSLRAVKSEVPGLLVAAGTVITPQDLDAVMDAGADLALSPGATTELLRAAAESEIPFIPGVATASEVMRGMVFGFDVFKLFPAQTCGGIAALKSLNGPFPNISFCPTGGLNQDNYREYLALSNVVCCGGTWMVNSTLLSQGNWEKIEELARQIMAG